MARAEILSTQAIHTLKQLHAELGGKLQVHKAEGDRLRDSMIQVEAVMKMLDPTVNVRLIAPKRRVTGNPWFKRGTLYRTALDMMRRLERPVTAAEIVQTLIRVKSITADRAQVQKLEAAVWAAMRKHEGNGIESVGDGKPARWQLIARPAA